MNVQRGDGWGVADKMGLPEIPESRKISRKSET